MATSPGKPHSTMHEQFPELEQKAEMVAAAASPSPSKRPYQKPALERRGVLTSVAGSIVWDDNGEQH